MDTLVKLNTQSSGRDKLFRLVQYSSRLVWDSLEKKKENKLLIEKLKDLEYILSTGRKLYRFGRGLDNLYAALSSLHLEDRTLRFTITLSRINMAFYLLSDHIIWMSRMNLINIDNTKWSKLNYKFWLYSLIMNLWRDFYEVRQILNMLNLRTLGHELPSKKIRPSNTIASKFNLAYQVLKLHKNVVADTVKNGCDVCIPLAQLGYLNVSPRTIGLLGMISSVFGILPLINSSYKLAP